MKSDEEAGKEAGKEAGEEAVKEALDKQVCSRSTDQRVFEQTPESEKEETVQQKLKDSI